ncbi:hypothetical protein RhiirC2_792794 [Rhizophagus irregularis]|uniref:Uncharacterized protein n=1 Tax=Rhizophagus irregularis TaxID=588596 RepID=A0A2N1MGQ7_9GLOM|nr:hypothetical protein RhiirC2_792794 [Rhizophagus irregularis]
MDNKTLIHLEFLDNLDAIVKATEAINLYYFHTLEHPPHRSENFWNSFIEHFSVFALNNLLPYTSSNSASSHNIEHLECVNKLIHGLEQLSNSVNRFLQKYYGGLYKNLNKLNWGPFAPRLFRVFPMAVINFNTISYYHWDEHDDPNSFYCLVVLGEFEGGELCFPQLEIIIPLRLNQASSIHPEVEDLLNKAVENYIKKKEHQKMKGTEPITSDCETSLRRENEELCISKQIQ